MHLAFIALSAISSVGLPQSLQTARAPGTAYLQACHFDFDGLPVYLADGQESEQSVVLEASASSSPGPDEWQTIDWSDAPGSMLNDRIQRWLQSAVVLANNEQPGLTASWLRSLTYDGSIAENAVPGFRSLRIVGLTTDLMTTDNDQGEEMFRARIVRDDDDAAMIQIRPPRLSSLAVPEAAMGSAKRTISAETP